MITNINRISTCIKIKIVTDDFKRVQIHVDKTSNILMNYRQQREAKIYKRKMLYEDFQLKKDLAILVTVND